MSQIRYWMHTESKHVNKTVVGSHPDGVAERDPVWVEVTVSPVVSGDVIEQAARALHAWDVEGGPCEGPWESLTPEQHEIWLSGARALADAGLLAGPRTVTAEVRRGLAAHDREVAARTLRDLGLSSRPYINPILPSQVRRLYDADLRERSIRGVLDLAANLIAGYAVVIARADQIEKEDDRG